MTVQGRLETKVASPFGLPPVESPIALPTDNTPLTLVGHVLEVLRRLPEGSVQCAVTSPPYFGLRAYGTKPQIWGGDPTCRHSRWDSFGFTHKGGKAKPSEKSMREGDLEGTNSARDASNGSVCHECNAWRGELGLEPTPELYVEHLALVFDEVQRVLRDDGVLWLNLGDSYVGGGRGSGIHKDGSSSLSSRQFWEHNSDGQVPRTLPGNGLKAKDLVGIPWRVAFALQARGWWLRSDVIWNKPNPMAESVRDRPSRSHEYVFLLTKKGRYFYDEDAVRNPFAESSVERMTGATFYTQTGGSKDYAKTGVSGSSARGVTERLARNAGYAESTLREVSTGYDGVATKDFDSAEAQDASAVKRRIVEGIAERIESGKIVGANLKSVWTIPTQPFSGAHFATFPEKLVETCISAGTSECGSCARCGAPWDRVVEEGPDAPEPEWRDPNKRLAPHQAGNLEDGNMGFRRSRLSGQEMNEWKAAHPDIQTGWAPTCACEVSKTVPCVVLDIFAGSGTTLMVARRKGLRSIGIDLNEVYLEIQSERPGMTASHIGTEWA